MVSSFLFFWSGHLGLPQHVWLPPTPSSWQPYPYSWHIYCILHFTEACVNTFLVLGAIHTCRERTRTNPKPLGRNMAATLHCHVQCTEFLKTIAKRSLESRTQLHKIHQKAICLLVWNKSYFKIDQLSASKDCVFYLSSEYFRKNKLC